MRIRNIHRTQAIALAGDLPRGEPCTCGTRSSGVAEMTLMGTTQGRGSSAAGSRGRSPQASHRAPFPSHASHLCGLACSRLKSVFANESRCGAVKEELTTSFQKNEEKGHRFLTLGKMSRAAGARGVTLTRPLQRGAGRLEHCWLERGPQLSPFGLCPYLQDFFGSALRGQVSREAGRERL